MYKMEVCVSCELIEKAKVERRKEMEMKVERTGWKERKARRKKRTVSCEAVWP